MMTDLLCKIRKKRLLALLVAVCIVTAQISFAAVGVYDVSEDEAESSSTVSAQGASSQEYVSGHYTYEVVDGKAIITDTDGWLSGSITIPSTLGGYTVTEIDDSAFYYCSITGVTIPNTVKRIGEDAFAWCYKLSALTIGSGVKTIGHSAFYQTALTTVTIPNSVTSIDDFAFGYSDLANVTIGSGVSSIGEGAFYGCSALSSISVNSGNAYYSSDSYGVLYNKSKTELIQYPIGNSRTSFTIPSSVTSIGYAAFRGTSNELEYPSVMLTAISIPSSVKTIGDEAFQNCTELTGSITLGNGVTSIGDFAFRNCAKITSVQIGTGASIGELAFYACRSLTSITVNTGNAYFCSEDGVLFNKAKTAVIQYPCGDTRTSYTVPSSVRTIHSGAFVQCQYLKTLTIASGTQKIEWGAL